MSQGALAEVLAATLAQHETVRGKAYQDIQDIGSKTLDALKALDPDRGGGGSILSVILAIASVALAIPTEGASLELAENITVKDALNFSANSAGAAQAIYSDLPKAGEELAIGGNTPAEMLDDMLTLINAVKGWMGRHNDNIAADLKHVSDVIQPKDLVMPKPKDATGADLATSP